MLRLSYIGSSINLQSPLCIVERDAPHYLLKIRLMQCSMVLPSQHLSDRLAMHLQEFLWPRRGPGISGTMSYLPNSLEQGRSWAVTVKDKDYLAWSFFYWNLSSFVINDQLTNIHSLHSDKRNVIVFYSFIWAKNLFPTAATTICEIYIKANM